MDETNQSFDVCLLFNLIANAALVMKHDNGKKLQALLLNVKGDLRTDYQDIKSIEEVINSS